MQAAPASLCIVDNASNTPLLIYLLGGDRVETESAAFDEHHMQNVTLKDNRRKVISGGDHSFALVNVGFSSGKVRPPPPRGPHARVPFRHAPEPPGKR